MSNLVQLVADPRSWRMERGRYDTQQLLADLLLLPGNLVRLRTTLLYLELNDIENAEKRLTGTHGPLAVAARAAVLSHKASQNQDDALLQEILALPEIVDTHGESLLIATEAQMMLDCIRGQIWRGLGNWQKAREFFRLAQREAARLGVPDTFIAQQLDLLGQSSEDKVTTLLKAVQTAPEGRERDTLAISLAGSALSILRLDAASYAATMLPAEGAAYKQAIHYLNTNRSAPAPPLDYPDAVVHALGLMALLEQALENEWRFEYPASTEIARQLLALPGINDPHAHTAQHIRAIIRARAWVVLKEYDSAMAEIERPASRLEPLLLLAKVIKTEAALQLGYEVTPLDLASQMEGSTLYRTQLVAARLAPAAVAYAADHIGQGWQDARRLKVQVITSPLHALGGKKYLTQQEAERIKSFSAFVTSHPDISFVPNAMLISCVPAATKKMAL